MQREKTWCVIYTRPGWGKKVAELLSRKNVENYCPLNNVLTQLDPRKGTVLQPLFNCYVFVRVYDIMHLPVKHIKGVLNIAYWLGEPALITNEEIEAIRLFLSKYVTIRLEQLSVEAGDKLRIVHTPLVCLEGNVLEVKSYYVKLYLPSLHYVMIAEEPVDSSNIIQRNEAPITAGINVGKIEHL